MTSRSAELNSALLAIAEMAEAPLESARDFESAKVRIGEASSAFRLRRQAVSLEQLVPMLAPGSGTGAELKAHGSGGHLCQLGVDPTNIPVLAKLRAHTFIAHDNAGRETAIKAMRTLLTRLLAMSPPGSMRFDLFDPSTSARLTAPMMPYGAKRPDLIGGGPLVEERAIHARLEELLALIAQRNTRLHQSPDVEHYNAVVGPVGAEPYHYVVAHDVEAAHYGPATLELLGRIARLGYRCGIFLLATTTFETANEWMYHVEQADADGQYFMCRGNQSVLQALAMQGDRGCLIVPALPVTWHFLDDHLGQCAGAAAALEAEQDQAVLPLRELLDLDNPWQADAAEELVAPIGRSGDGWLELRLSDTPAHGLLAGATGYGKSSLLHSVIVALTLRYPPNQLELYLVDMKRGVEFNDYLGDGTSGGGALPHARVVATDADPEYALAVLEALTAEMARRGDLMREAHVSDLVGYRRTGGTMTRIVAVIDEFQNLFADQYVADDAWRLLAKLAREGRAHGVHLLLGSQNLSGLRVSTTSERAAVFEQFGLRIALHLSPDQSSLVLGEGNRAAADLHKQGEGIYNSAGGAPDHNRRFQAAYVEPSWRREVILDMAERVSPRPPVHSFAGDQRATLSSAPMSDRPGVVVVPVGHPLQLREELTINLTREQARNIAVVGQDAEVAARLLMAMALGGCPDPVFLNFVAKDNPLHDQISQLAGNLGATEVVGARSAAEWLGRQAKELAELTEGGGISGLGRVVFAFGLHRARLERGARGETAPGDDLIWLLDRGPELGLFVVGWWSNLTTMRDLDRNILNYFDNRILLPDAVPDADTLVSNHHLSLRDNRVAVWNRDEPTVVTKAIPYWVDG